MADVVNPIDRLSVTRPVMRPSLDSLVPQEVMDRPDNLDGVAIADVSDESVNQTVQRIRDTHDAALLELAQDLMEDPESERLQEVEFLDRSTELQVPSVDEDLSRYYIEDSLAYENPAYLSQSVVLLRNRQIFLEELQRFVNKVDATNTPRSVLNWLDYNIARAGINAVEMMTDRTSRQGSQFYTAMMDTNPENVRNFARSKVEDAMREGIVFEGSGSALDQLEREMFSFGNNPEKVVDLLLGGLEFATLGATGLAVRGGAAAVRAVRRGAVGGATAPTAVAPTPTTISNLRGSTTLSRASDAEVAAAAANFGLTPSTRAGAVGGREAADRVAVNVLARTDDVDTLTDVQTGLHGPVTGTVQPSHSRFRQAAEETSIQRDINALEQRGGIRTTETKAYADRVATDLVEQFRGTYGARYIKPVSRAIPVYSDAARSLIEGYQFQALLGKADGTAFKTQQAAQKFADQVGGNVVPDGPKGFLVSLEQRINTTAATGGEISLAKTIAERPLLIRKLDDALATVFRITGLQSRRYADVQELDDLALLSQASERRLLSALDKRQSEALSKLSSPQQAALDDVLTQLNNQSGEVAREWDELEFSRLYKNKTGELPSNDVIEAFKAYHDISDQAYLMEARLVLQRVVRNGFTQSVKLSDSFSSAAKKVAVDTVDDAEVVFNGRTGEFMKKGDLQDIDRLAVFLLNDAFEEGANVAKYAVMPKNVSSVKASDVLGYAAYGRRSNPEITNFLVLSDENGRLKTILGARTTNQSLKAKEEFEAIQKAISDSTLSKASVNRIIRENNSWNPDIEDLTDLNRWFKENGIDPFIRGSFISKARNARITTGEGAPAIFGDESTISEVVNYGMSRSKYVLTEYGGAKAYNPSAVESIVTQYATTSKAWAYNFYTYRAAQGWMELATRLAKEGKIQIDNLDGIPTNDWIRRFQNAEIKGSGDFAEQFREAQSVFAARREQKTIVDQKIELAIDRAIEKINDSKFLSQFGLKADPNFLKGVPQDALKLGFFSAFWADLDQAFLQSTGMLSSLTLAREGVGLKGAGSQRIMRKIMAAAKDSAEEKILLKRLADRLDITLADAEEMAVLWRDMQPHIVLNDIMEMGTGLGADTLSEGIGGVMGKIRRSAAGRQAGAAFNAAKEIGLKPFNWGEINTKATAFQIALLEYKAVNPTASLLDDAARTYVARRTETLSTNMTSQSRSNIQRGVGAIPTQWLGFTLRLTEQVFAGRDLTPFERSKLFFVYAPLWGVAGIPFTNGISENIAISHGIDPSTEEGKALFVGIKYGLLDGLISYFTPFDTAIGSKIAPFTMYEDLYEKLLVDRDIATILGGPSGSIIYTGYEAVSNLLGSISRGHTSSFNEDAMRVVRNFAGANNVAGAIGILNEGIYRNRKGLTVPVDLDPLDAVTAFFGYSPLEVQEFYNIQSLAFRGTREFQRYSRQIRERSDLAWSIMADDPSRGIQIIQEAQALIDNYPVSEQSKRDLNRLLNIRTDNRVGNALETLRRRDSSLIADFTREIIN
jgi:hypothetical protein